SLFYGTILGIFIVAFYFKRIGGSATFKAALVTEVFVFTLWLTDAMAFLWLNVAGCLALVVIAWVLESITKRPVKPSTTAVIVDK
ncbi:MAG TPA: hypothetical protein VLZ28_06580, partial [Daejeonella sp.]|nr:hypothetical protein [Daejeonella sp.]